MEILKTSGYAPINGISMYYELHGEGDIPLILIHGGGSTIGITYGNLLPFLAADHKVIAIELQAHGRTTDRDTPESFEQDADDVAALLKYLNIPKANIIGFSNGGTTTLQLAIRHPQVVNKIIPIAAAYKRDGFMTGFFDFMNTATFDSMPQPLKTAFLEVTPHQDRLLNMFNKDKQRMIDFADISDDVIRAIQAPALFMVSDKDVITMEHTIKMAQLVPGASVAILPGAHGVFIGDAGMGIASGKLPQATAIFIADFLKD